MKSFLIFQQIPKNNMRSAIEFSKGLSRPAQNNGFALVATLTLLILLSLLCLGMLSLSSISLRSSGQGNAQADARANARMALMIAIGELQKQLGPDQRVSANGAILSDSNVRHPMWTGVWDSWKAGDSSKDSLDGFSAHSTIGGISDTGMAPTYVANRNDHFRTWLLSLEPQEAATLSSATTLALPGSAMPGSGDTAVRLVGEGSLGESDPDGFVSARLLPVTPPAGVSSSGRYGWWVGDESQKARIMADSYNKQASLSLAEKIARTQAPGSTGTKVITDLEGITADQEAKLGILPTLKTLDVLVGDTEKSPANKNFHSVTTLSKAVIADVREGGLKRDLSTILERKIDPAEVYDLQTVSGLEAQFKRAQSISSYGNDFMLYRFDDMVQSSVGKTGEASVPIQDLAAYYQLYDHSRPGWKGGIQFSTTQSSPSNNLLPGGIMVSNPDFGVNTSDYDKYLRQTSALYRSVYPIKMEFVISYLTEQRTQAEMDADRQPPPAGPGIANPDTHKLKVGYTPAMTFWNPNNVPVVMNLGNPELSSIMIRETPVPMQVEFRKHNSLGGPVVANNVVQFDKLTNTQQGELYTLFISGKQSLVFEPGESKVVALQASSNTNPAAGLAEIDFLNRSSGVNENFFPEHELIPGWNPEKFVRPATSRFGNRAGRGAVNILTFKPADYISAVINTGAGRSFNVDFTQKSRHARNAVGVMWHYRTYALRLRMFPGGYPNFTVYHPFRTAFNAAGTAPGGTSIVNTAMNAISIPARSGQTLVDSMQSPTNFFDDLPQAFFYYGMRAATETHELSNAFPATGRGGSRRFPSRPFTHSTVMMPQFIDNISGASLYNSGWNWFFTPLDNLIDAPVSISSKNHGYYGGGYTAENGATHIVQQELPVAPPISIAALSHAQLSGYSLSSEAAAAGYAGLQNLPGTEAFRRTTALGFGGLEPRTLQAIGNSYAHPYIPKNKAITTLGRVFYQSTGTPTPTPEPFADHSYLANKALWDEYFFSSITPVPSDNPVFDDTAKSAEEVTRAFLSDTKQLPNRRMVPYAGNLDESRLATLLAGYSEYQNGFADKIAANMMLEGPFNINSTSEAAWRTLFSSLRGKTVTYLDPKDSVSGSLKTKEEDVAGVPVGSGFLPNGKPYTGSSADPSDAEQWNGWRELTDDEISELAKAMVKQVRLRGPFLSMSEFVNRRLDSNSANTGLSVMGALQAAIDDPDCSINAGFRDSARKFSSSEKSFAAAVFPEAMDGAIAYGSSAYVDQADILRNFAEQLTPRGDTFVIRAYGDSADASGKVVARAWCEAVVQRMPDYLDPADEPQLKQSALTSASNRTFGRRFDIVQFRWLNASEI